MSELQDPEIFRTVLDSLQTGVSIADRNGKILFWNQGAERLTGHKRHDVVGRSCRDSVLVHCDGQGCVACGASCPISRTLHEGKPQEAKIQLLHKEGYPVHVLMRISYIRDPHNSIVAVVASFDEQKLGSEWDRDLNTLAEHGCMDETSGLPNHEFAEFHLTENLASFARYHLPFGVIAIQIDQLEQFRATYGRPAGDALLRVVAQTMKNSFRPTDFVARWTDDQFLAILVNCGEAGVEKTWERIQKMFTRVGLRWWSDELLVATSVGYATAQAEDTIDSLWGRARLSLQRAFGKSAAAAAVSSQSPPISET